jgi:hypothetical protein
MKIKCSYQHGRLRYGRLRYGRLRYGRLRYGRFEICNFGANILFDNKLNIY